MRAMWRAWFARTPYLQAPCALTAAIPDGRSTLRSGHVRTSLAIAVGAVEVKQSCDEIPRSYSDFVPGYDQPIFADDLYAFVCHPFTVEELLLTVHIFTDCWKMNVVSPFPRSVLMSRSAFEWIWQVDCLGQWCRPMCQTNYHSRSSGVLPNPWTVPYEG